MKKTLLIGTVLLLASFVNAQGCSDAGICTVNKGFTADSLQLNNNLEFSSIYSTGEADLQYLSHYASFTKRLNKRIAFTGKVTLSTANGSFGTITQLGDAFLVGNYSFKEKNKTQWSALLGFKFPFTNSNTKINGNSIPLDYQSSLGTIDLFVGTNLHHKKWDFNTAIQIPILNLNENSYRKEITGSNDFSSTNLFERKPDALLRATYTIKTPNNKFIFKPNVLFIYHLGEDTFENLDGRRTAIEGSDGLTLNGNIITAYQINKQNQIELSVATPFIVRDIRPDGLTRSFVMSVNYRYSF
jgi:hypothetical protein